MEPFSSYLIQAACTLPFKLARRQLLEQIVSRKWLSGSIGEQRARMGEHQGSIGEQRGSKCTKWALAREQCGDAIYVKLEDAICMYIYI